MISNRRLILITVLILVLVVAFFWKETLSLGDKINHEKVSSFFSILAAVFTSFTLFLLIKQTTLQRQSTANDSMPHLFVKNVEFEVDEYKQTEDARSVFQLWPLDKNERIIPKEKRNYFDGGDRYIQVINVGKGVALNVSARWNFSEKVVVDIVGADYDWEFWDERSSFTDYIMPNTYSPLISPSILHSSLYSKIYQLPTEKRPFKAEHILKPIPIELWLKYCDIHNNVYEKVFEVDVSSFNGMTISFEFKLRR